MVDPSTKDDYLEIKFNDIYHGADILGGGFLSIHSSFVC